LLELRAVAAMALDRDKPRKRAGSPARPIDNRPIRLL
jgi:hypothetical protein